MTTKDILTCGVRTALLALPLSAALLLAGCTESADRAGGNADLAIRTINVGVAGESATRTAADDDTHGQSGCFDKDDLFFAVASQGASLQTAVYKCGEKQPTNAYNWNAATAVGLPLMGSATTETKVRAFAPYQVGPTTGGQTVSATHLSRSFTVQQTQQTWADLKASDLLYAEATVAANGTQVKNEGGDWHQADKLSFRHQLSMLVIRLINNGGDGHYPKLKRLLVTSGYRTIALSATADGTMTLAAGSLSDALSERQPLTVFDGNETIDYTTATEGIGLHPTLTANYHVCILPPQTLAAGVTTIQAQTDLGTVSYYLTEAKTLEAGKSYHVDLPVVPVDQATVSITGWGEPTAWTYTAPGNTEAAKYHSAAAMQFKVGSTEFSMVPVKGGYMNLTVNADISPASNDRPKITFNETLDDYYLGETEVTQGLWRSVMGGLVKTAGGSEALSAQKVTGDDYAIGCTPGATIDAFIAELNRVTDTQRPAGYVFALPSAAQWVYAANERNGSAFTYKYSGSDNLDEVAWHAGDSNGDQGGNALGTMHPVAQLKPNALGLYDMTGSQGEWTSTINPLAADRQLSCGGTWWCGVNDLTIPLKQSVYGNGQYNIANNQDWGLRLALVRRAPAVGDLYFSDGTWGTKQEWPAKAAGLGTVKPIGIVFSTSPTAADRQRGYSRGYVMALKNAASGVKWSSALPTAIYTKSVKSDRGEAATMAAETRAEMEGLSNSLALAGNPGGLTYTANDAARNYTPAAPATSSGWFLPSIGQLMMIADTFNGLAFYFKSTSGGGTNVGVWGPGAVALLVKINSYVENRLVDASVYDDFENGTRMWSSTVSSNNLNYAWQFIYEGGTSANDAVCVYGCTYSYTAVSRVRPVLAF